MQSRDMSDAELMEMMTLHVSALMELSSYSRNDFFRFIRRDAFTEYGVCKALELVGEAAAYVSQAGHAEYPEIDFAKYRAWRLQITHGYSGVRMADVYEVITRDIPVLHRQLNQYGLVAT